MIQLKKKENSNIILKPTKNNFHSLIIELSTFGRVLGIDLCDKSKKTNTSNILWQLLTQSVLLGSSLYLSSQIILQHKAERSDLSMDMYCFSGAFMALILCIQIFIIFYHQDLLRSLFDRCEAFYKKKKDSNLTKCEFEVINGNINHIIRGLEIMAYVNPVCLTSLSIIVSMIVKQFQFILPVYHRYEWMNRIHWIICLDSFFFLFSFFFNRVLFFVMCLFATLCHNIGGEYKCLAATVKKIQKNNKGSIDSWNELNSIGQRHAKVLEMVKDLDITFSKPLLASEIISVTCIPLFGISCWLDTSVFSGGVGATFVFFFLSFISLLGQYIGSCAENFSTALSECDWIKFSAWERKQLALMMLMAQKPVGVRSGGFYYVNHGQLTQVSN